jgi:hypothetical protein
MIRKIIAAALGGAVLLTLAACAAPATEEVYREGVAAEPGAYGADEAFVEPQIEGEMAALPAESGVYEDVGASVPEVPEAQQQRMVIKTGEMALLVQDTDSALDQIGQIAADNGGYILSSQSWQVGEGKAASITIAVLAENFETAQRRLRAIAIEVQTENSSGQDVTAEYVDLESRLRNLEATRDRIRTFLDQATTVEEALRVNQELSAIEAEIETVKGRMVYLQGRSAYSTIAISLSMPQPAAPTPTPSRWSLGPTISSAVRSQTRLVQFLLEAGTWLVVVLGPYALALALVIVGIRALALRRKRRRSAQLPEPTAEE